MATAHNSAIIAALLLAKDKSAFLDCRKAVEDDTLYSQAVKAAEDYLAKRQGGAA